MQVTDTYDAILIVGFGGPEKPEDVLPFLENVTRGRSIPRERLMKVAEQYDRFGGVSPINGHVRDLIAALSPELESHGINLPIYWGNRNWHPLLTDELQRMQADGVQRALAVVLSAYGSYSSCRQYLQNIDDACAAAGENAPSVDKLRLFYNHPEFIAANVERLGAALEQIPKENRHSPRIAFTAHSIPDSMATGCDYAAQLTETCRLVSEQLGITKNQWQLVYQSRSGRPSDPWLEPDICDHLEDLANADTKHVIIMPIGFLSDHLEVLFDLDTQAAEKASELDLNLVRAATVGVHPRFIGMFRELIVERLDSTTERRASGTSGPWPDICAAECCPAPQHRPVPAT
jgi:ferrochelatase